MMGLPEKGSKNQNDVENQEPKENWIREPGDGTSIVSTQSIALEEIVNGANEN